MGAAYYISLEHAISGFDAIGLIDGKALARESKTLEKLASELGVRRLMDFFSDGTDDLEHLMDKPEFDPTNDERFVALGPGVRWFSAAEGLTTVRALRRHVAAHRGDLVQAERVLFDLECFERVLGRAEAAGVRWHLAMDA